MSRQLHAVVVGAGIGGLASAVGLQRAGWHVQVLERRSVKAIEAEPGSGISVWPNGLRALAALGVQEPILAGAAFGGRSGVRTPTGRWIARMDFGDAIRERYGLPLIITRRARLVEVLVDALGADRIEYAAEVDGIDTARPAAHFAGAVTQADLVVVADGARSRLRRTVLDSDPELRYAGYTSWRFIAPRPPDPVEPAETWGRRGQRFAILPLDDTYVYCYATADAPAGRHATDEREELRARFGNWHAPIPQLLDALPPDAVIRTDIAALADPPTTLHGGRVALVGDAAHAMTPDLGQGACQALEDAATLAALLRPENEIEQALADYTRLRGKRTADIVRRSRRAGRLYQSPAWIRSVVARVGDVVPAALTVRSFAATVDWHPPDGPEHVGRPS